MPSKKRILFFVTSLADGGAERALLNLLRALDKTKYDITLRVIYSGGSREKDVPDGVSYKPIIKTKSGFLKKLLRKVIMCPLFSKAVYNLFIEDGYDIEVAYIQGAATYIIQSGKSTCRRIAYVHTAISEEFVMNVLKIYKTKENIYKCYSEMSAVCFVSRGAKSEFEKNFGQLGNSYVVHNIIDVDRIVEMSNGKCDISYESDKINIVTCSRIVPIKGIDRILDAAKEIGDKDKYRVYIVGSGSEEEKYRAYIAENGLDNVRMVSYKANVYPYMKNADLYVSASISESYGLSIVEALVLGVPLVTTKLPSLGDIISEGRDGGVMVVENSHEGVKNGLEKYLLNADFRAEMKKAAIENAAFYREKFALYYGENERLLIED